MSFNESNPPDWDRLNEINAEAQALVDAGKLTEDEFKRLLAEGEKAVNGHEMFLGGLLMFAQMTTAA